MGTNSWNVTLFPAQGVGKVCVLRKKKKCSYTRRRLRKNGVQAVIKKKMFYVGGVSDGLGYKTKTY